MTQRDWQAAFGDAPEDFRLRLRTTLEQLEETDMQRRHKHIAALLVAALIALLIAGAAVAAGQLGVFRLLNTAEPIVPLEGAEDLVETQLGSAENDYMTVTVEEAVYDGQCAMVQLRLTPRDPERFALFHDMLQEADEETYDVENRPVPVPEDDIPHLIPDETPTRMIDGKLYYADVWDRRVLGRRDGKQLINFGVRGNFADEASAKGEPMQWPGWLGDWDGQEEPDGSVIVWAMGCADAPLGERIRLALNVHTRIGDEDRQPFDLAVTLTNSGDSRTARLEPEEGDMAERVQIRACEITFTRVQGYLTLEYAYRQAEDEPMGIDFHVLGPGGERLHGGGMGETEEIGTEDGFTLYRHRMSLQALEQMPEALTLEAKVIGEAKTLGRLRCRVVPEA